VPGVAPTVGGGTDASLVLPRAVAAAVVVATLLEGEPICDTRRLRTRPSSVT
jgi:hypothetical protein